ncbi:MAG TPA: transcription antitermination factor NusB [Bacteroidales bacterium]|nr:transcription antitermination factor NusB [Bacteroidales bacterium]
MLSRRLIRIKVMQALYAFAQNDDNELSAMEKNLIKNIDRVYELYIWQLSFLVELIEYFRFRMDEARQKFLPTQEELHPSTRFVDNRLIQQLQENEDYNQYHSRYKINWAGEQEMFRSFYNEIRSSEEYISYMNAEKNYYEDDKNILIKLIRAHLLPSETLEIFFEEKNIHWADDYSNTLLMVMRTLKSFAAKQDASTKLPTLFEDEETEIEDKAFASDLFAKSILYSDEYSAIIALKAKNWELDRIAMLDIIIMKMAIVELLQFPSVPVKVTLNEYIEISKQYSTPKSKIFINGLLDKLIVEFREEDKIKKTGRGLIDN